MHSQERCSPTEAEEALITAAAALLVAPDEQQELGGYAVPMLQNLCELDWRQQDLAEHFMRRTVNKRLKATPHNDNRTTAQVRRIVKQNLRAADLELGGRSLRARQQSKVANAVGYDEPPLVWEIRGAMIDQNLCETEALSMVQMIQEQQTNQKFHGIVTPWQCKSVYLETLEVYRFNRGRLHSLFPAQAKLNWKVLLREPPEMEESKGKDESESEGGHPSRKTRRRPRNSWPRLTVNGNAPSQKSKTDREEPKQTWSEELDADTPTRFELLLSSLIADVGSQLLEKSEPMTLHQSTTSRDQELLSNIQLEADTHIHQEEKEM